MRKLLVCILAGMMALSMGACGKGQDGGTTEEESAFAEEDVVAYAGDEEDTDQSEDLSGSGDVDVGGDDEPPDLSGAVDGMGSSIDDPVPFGTWAKTSLYATQDDTFHTVYVRIKDIIKQGQDANFVVDAINTHNENVVEDEWISVADLDIPSDAELVVMEYEVYVPEDFPAPSYGMAEPKLYFTVKNKSGTGIPSAYGNGSYVGLNATYELDVRDPSEIYYPGNVYEEQCLYVMVKGYTDYVITYFTFPEGTMSGEMSTENMYTVYHAVK